MRQNGALRIFYSDEKENISLYIRDGNLIHASSSDMVGLNAFFKALKSESGYFKFLTGETQDEVSINKPIAFLLLESQHRADELRHLQNLLPPDDSVLFIVPDPGEIPRLNTSEWRVLAMVNGRRTLKRICDKIGDELQVKKILLELFNKKLTSITSGEASWKELVPIPVPSHELTADRPYPPLLRTNLLLKAIDGKTPLKDLIVKLNLKENDLAEDIKLLVDTRWIGFPHAQAALFSRLRHEL